MEPIRTLPDNWRQRIAGYKPAPALARLTRHLQEIVNRRGKYAISLGLVQDLAVLACFDRMPHRLEFYGRLQARIQEGANSDWPISAPLSEHYVGSKPPLALASELASITAEWLVLDHLIASGWKPLPSTRGPGRPDWLIERDVILPVEVKFKKHPAHAPIYWAELLTGVGMLPGAQFLQSHIWTWEIAPETRDGDVFHLIRVLVDQLDQVERILRTGMGRLQQPIPLSGPPTFEFVAKRGLAQDGEASDSIDLLLETSGRILTLSARPSLANLHGAWEPCSPFATWERACDRSLSETLTTIFTRLGIGRQVARAPETLVVLVWQVPVEISVLTKRHWFKKLWCELAEKENWPKAILWPIGVHSCGDGGWIENPGATSLLSGRLANRPSTAGNVPEPVDLTS